MTDQTATDTTPAPDAPHPPRVREAASDAAEAVRDAIGARVDAAAFDLTDTSRGSDEVPHFDTVPVASVAPETILDAIITYADGSPVRDFTDRLTAYAQAGLMGATVIPVGVAYHVADDGG